MYHGPLVLSPTCILLPASLCESTRRGLVGELSLRALVNRVAAYSVRPEPVEWQLITAWSSCNSGHQASGKNQPIAGLGGVVSGVFWFAISRPTNGLLPDGARPPLAQRTAFQAEGSARWLPPRSHP